MAKVIAIMSMSLDGFVADRNDGVAEVFDWYTAGDIVVPTASPEWTFRVSAPSAEHLRTLTGQVGAMLTGRRTFETAAGWGGQHPWGIPAFEIHIDLIPVLLGSGIPLFDQARDAPVVLGNPTVVAGAGVTHLRYPVPNS
jgi:dihydrofolate reductase